MTVRGSRACMVEPALMTSTVSHVHVEMALQETTAKVNVLLIAIATTVTTNTLFT